MMHPNVNMNIAPSMPVGSEALPPGEPRVQLARWLGELTDAAAFIAAGHAAGRLAQVEVAHPAAEGPAATADVEEPDAASDEAAFRAMLAVCGIEVSDAMVFVPSDMDDVVMVDAMLEALTAPRSDEL